MRTCAGIGASDLAPSLCLCAVPVHPGCRLQSQMIMLAGYNLPHHWQKLLGVRQHISELSHRVVSFACGGRDEGVGSRCMRVKCAEPPS